MITTRLRALKCAWLASAGCALLAAAPAQAQVNGTWTGTTSNVWNTGTNWTSSPTVPTGTATFSGAGPTTVAFTASATIQTIQFNSGAPAYTFQIPQ
jgi:hypothetical protein